MLILQKKSEQRGGNHEGLGVLAVMKVSVMKATPLKTHVSLIFINLLQSSGQDFYTPLALNSQEGQHLLALEEVYDNQSTT